MKLAYVEICGFRGFRDKARFEFPAGFVVLTGRNGVGKSAVLDAVDFALTGSINKFNVTSAKGGGPESHTWWVGSGHAEENYVKVGIVSSTGEELTITRSSDYAPSTQDLMTLLCSAGHSSPVSPKTLMETTLIRDELITALSIDLPGQARFEAVRAAIGNLLGTDYSQRAAAIVTAAKHAVDEQERKYEAAQADLGRTLSTLTEARSAAERAKDVGDALRVLDGLPISVPSDPASKASLVRQFIVRRKESLGLILAARSRALHAVAVLTDLGSGPGKAEIDHLNAQLASSSERIGEIDKLLRDAEGSLQRETEDNEVAAHLSALIEHGETVGLQEGHCPLCDAARSQSSFASAIAAAKAKLASRGEKLSSLRATVAQTQDALRTQQALAASLREELSRIADRNAEAEATLAATSEVYRANGFEVAAEDTQKAERLASAERDWMSEIERALFLLEASSIADTVTSLEARATTLRSRVDQEAAILVNAQKVLDLSRQIETTVKTVANELSTERFDTVMPLLRELYRRLRPHTDWLDIASDFGGKVRASLNFTVGDGHNVQFLFSSGQRRAAGLAFLLSIHLSRRWCRWNTLMLDDPVQHIDDYRALNLVEVLASIRRTGRQVIVSVEDISLANLLCRRLRSTIAEPGRMFCLETATSGSAAIHEIHDVSPMPKEVLYRAQA